MPIDLRSDTVTKPSQGMLQAMMGAKVGDDVWGDDPTVHELQDTLASLFGMEAGLFCPSGTMCNQIAIKLHTQPGDELLCADTAHVYVYEGAGIAFNSGVQAKALPAQRGLITASQVEAAVNPDDPHFPATTLVCLENTTNKGGGAVYTLQSMQGIRDVCIRRKLRLHLDGARVFNAFAESEYGPRDLGQIFDTISVCLSKGLGCPVGSVLLGSKDLMRTALRIRKVLGGGMRQSGFLAAAGLYALENNISRLKDDHARAKKLGVVAANLPFVTKVLPVETNIVLFEVKDDTTAARVVSEMQNRDLLACAMSDKLVRFVTHLDVDEEMIAQACQILGSMVIE